MSSFADVFPGASPSPLLQRFSQMLEPMGERELEQLAQQAHRVTLANFGRAMRLFAPLYLSNECINTCTYCGFSRDNPILRVTLEVNQLLEEARHLKEQGFRNILLVAGEHPKYVSNGYMERCIRALAPEVPSVSLEIAPMETVDYVPLVRAGAEGLIVYQETYHPETYAQLHVSGPKKNFSWRLACPERAYDAGFRRLGVGALFGLWHWKEEAMALAAHVEHLLKHCWKAQLTVSFPRIQPAAGGFVPQFPLPDREFVQLVCAMRVCFPQVGIILSTREPKELRDSLIPLGVTMMSAGSHTEPGGYTGQGKEALHQTVRGRQIALEQQPDADTLATGQFDISDDRSPAEIAALLRSKGYEPVWKDWDAAILNAQAGGFAA